MEKKTVSVVMCTYQGARFLSRQLESLLAQTYRPLEIIVQDDGSTDQTMDILKTYTSATPLIKVFVNEGKHGINANFFSALQRAQGDYIAICDQDDVWEPTKIERQMAAIGDNWMCGGFSKPFSEDNAPVKWDGRMPCLDLLRLTYLSEIPGHVQLISRALLQLLPKEGEFACLYDWQLQTIAAAAGRLVFVPEVLVHFRRHTQAATFTKPVSNHGLKGLKTCWFVLRHYNVLHHCAEPRFTRIIVFLDRLPFDNNRMREARELARLQSGRGVRNYIRFTLFCMRHHNSLFHAAAGNRLVSVLRAAYFPLYALNYYRAAVR